MIKNLSILLLSIALIESGRSAPVASSPALVEAVTNAAAGDIIEIGEGTFQLEEPLQIRSGVSLKGSGIGKTIVTHSPGWRANPATLPDPETNFRKFDRTGYLLVLEEKASDIAISGFTLTGPQVHGGIFGWGNKNVHLHEVRFENFMYSGFRSYILSGSRIENCTFVDTGSRWENGKPGLKGGITGGGIFAIWISDTEIANNRFLDTRPEPHLHYYGIKGREAKRVKIHHNTIEANFSIEFAHENDQDVEISHNVCHGTISIPKHAGGSVPESGRTFHIHHNLLLRSYAIEFVRNGIEISHNLFDFDLEDDGGNLISGFGSAPAEGPALFHNNLVNNPGRGVIWINEPYAGLTVRNNHIIARTTPTPRTEGLFGFNPGSDFPTYKFENNIIECEGRSRPLFRNDESAEAAVSNNRLVNVSDTERYGNPKTEAKAGPEGPLEFACGVDGEVKVDGWMTNLVKKPD